MYLKFVSVSSFMLNALTMMNIPKSDAKAQKLRIINGIGAVGRIEIYVTRNFPSLRFIIIRILHILFFSPFHTRIYSFFPLPVGGGGILYFCVFLGRAFHFFDMFCILSRCVTRKHVFFFGIIFLIMCAP